MLKCLRYKQLPMERSYYTHVYKQLPSNEPSLHISTSLARKILIFHHGSATLRTPILITKKINASSVMGLMSFRASSQLHQRLSEDVGVLRAISYDCLRLFLLHSPIAEQRRLMQLLTLSGHAHYCVIGAARLLHHTQPDLQMIPLVLRNTLRARSNEAIYFLLMLRVFADDSPPLVY